MIKTLSFKVDEEVIARLEAEATAKETTVSHLCRAGIEAYFNGEGQRQQNMKTIMERLDRVEYEVVCVRSMLGRSYSEEDYKLVKQLAHEEAAAYVEGLKK